MDLFKKKYCKVFPLTIFITQCSDSEEEKEEKKVTFDDAKRFCIYTTSIKVNDEGNFDENDDELFHNDAGYTIKKEFDENNIIQGDLLNNSDKKCSSYHIDNALKNYVYGSKIVKGENGKKIKNYDLEENGFKAKYTFELYFYKIINKKVSLYNSKEQKINLNESNKKINLRGISENEKFEKIKKYNEKIFFILKQLFPSIQSNKDCIISIDKNKLNKKNDNNLETYKYFIEKLQDYNGDKIKIVLDDYYKPNIKDILLSKNLKKTYKITDNKKKEIKGILKGSYSSYKYSELQGELKRNKKFKNITIENGNTDEYIEDLDNVTITITEDKGKNKNRVIVPKQCTIKFEVSKGLFITDSENYPASQDIEFSEDGITTKIVIDKYINEKYPKIKDKCTITKEGDKSGKFEDGTIVTVTINEEIKGITTNKDPNKDYIKVQFKVSDPSKFNFKENLAKTNEFNLEFEKNKKISDLLAEIKTKLGNTDLKEGYKIEKDNTSIKDNGTKLVDDATYIITLANDDTNFVEEIKKDKPEEKPEEEEDHKDKHKEEEHKEDNITNNGNNTNNTENDNTKKKGCCCGKCGNKNK